MRTAYLAVALALVACSPSSGASNRPTLGAVLSRVDVPRLLKCGGHLPNYAAAATCLGAEAASQALKGAFDAALAIADRARDASGPAGADDMTDDERQDLGDDLDAALDVLAAEIDATHAAATAE